jgi:hypothetical protein
VPDAAKSIPSQHKISLHNLPEMTHASRVQQHSAGIFFGLGGTAPVAQFRSFSRSKPELKLIDLWVQSLLPLRYIKGVPAPRIKADAANSFRYPFAVPQTNDAGIYCTVFNADKSAPRVFKSVSNFYSSKLYTSSRFESSSG